MGIAETVWPDGEPVNKSNVRADDKNGHRRTLGSVDDVHNTNLSGQFGGIYVRTLKSFFDLDTSDDQDDDGENVIYDLAGNHFVKLDLGSGSGIESLVEGRGVTVDDTDPANPIVSADVGQFGFRNRLINSNGKVWQRANSGAAAITDGTYAFDRWYGLTQSAGVTASQVTNAENGTPYMMRLSQANATAQRMGIAQAIESLNIIDARGQDVTLSARVRMSASATLRYAIIEWMGTADAIAKDVVNSWTSATFTPGNFFNPTSLTIAAIGSVALTANTLVSIDLTGAVSGSANNLIAFFWTDATQAQNVTLDIGKVQLEIGATATPLAARSATEDLNDCMRYYFSSDNGSYIVQSGENLASQFKVRMRAVPSVTATPNAGTFSINGSSVDAMFGSCTSLAAVAIVANAEI
jgi:hypothetical protein